jgi:hypothetical protein
MSSSPPGSNCPNCGAAFPVLGPAPGEPLKCPICGWIYSSEGADDVTLARELPEDLKVPAPAKPPQAAEGQPPAPEAPAAGPVAPAAVPEVMPAAPSTTAPPPTGAAPDAASPMANVTSGYSIASLVLGICSICTCMCYGIPSLVCGILAVVFSRRGERDASAGLRGEQSFGLSKAGRITGWIGIGLSAVYFLIIIAYIIFIVFMIGQNGWR